MSTKEAALLDRQSLLTSTDSAFRLLDYDALRQSGNLRRGVFDGRMWLSPRTKAWLGPLASQLPRKFWVHDNQAAHAAAASHHASAFVRGNHMFLGESARLHLESVVKHELVHLAQVEMTRRGAQIMLRGG